MTLKRFLLYTLTFIVAITAAAQDRYAMMQKSDSILNLFEDRFIVLDSLIFGNNNHRNVTSDIFIQASRKYGDTLLADSLYNAALDKSVEAQAKYIKSPTGLQITGQTYWRLDDQLDLTE